MKADASKKKLADEEEVTDDLGYKMFMRAETLKNPLKKKLADEEEVAPFNMGATIRAQISADMAASFADNSLTCDSEGNCMLKDELTVSEILTAKAIALAKDQAAKVYQKAKAGIYSGNDKRDAYVPQ